MNADFQCVFRRELSTKTDGADNLVKFLTITKKRSDEKLFLQVRVFNAVRSFFTPTMQGVSLSSRQTFMMVELMENLITLERGNDEVLTPEGLHNLTGDAYLGVVKGGKEMLLLRKSGDGLKGVTLTIDEYRRLAENVGPIHHLMFPSPNPKNVEILEAVAYSLRRILEEIRYEKCEGCRMELGNQEGHPCISMKEETLIQLYFHEAVKRINLPYLLKHVEYLHGLLKCGNPLPPIEEVQSYFKEGEWLIRHIQKESTYEALLTSFDELHQ